MGNSSQFLIHKKHSTFPAAVWASDFAAALRVSCANGTTAKSLRDSFAGRHIKKKEERNASPATLARLTPRNTSIIYWSVTRRRGNAELQIEMWRRIDGVTGSRYEPACSILFIYFLPKSSEFFFLSLSTYLPRTHSLSAGVWWSHEKQFHGRWPESPQNLQPYDTELSCRSAAHTHTHTRTDTHTHWATALVAAFHVAPDDIGANTHSGQVILIMLW